MTTYAGKPIEETIITSFPSGQVRSETLLTPTVVEDTLVKVPTSLPMFVPGNFLVKPYSLQRSVFGGAGATKEGRFVRSDGVKFHSLWSGPLDSANLVRTQAAVMLPANDPVNLRRWRWNKALSKIDNSLFDGGVELGELRETLEMLRNPFKSLRDLLNKDNEKLRRGIMASLRNIWEFMRNVKRSGSVASDTWLEVRYGVRPLLNTIQSITEAVAADLEAADLSIHRRVSQTTSRQTKKSTILINSRYRVHLSADKTELVYGKAYYRRFIDQGIDSAIGFAPQQIPEVVWEWTRLSFVWDWIVGIGPFLGAIRFRPGISILGGISGFKTTVNVTIESERKVLNSPTWIPSSAGEKYTSTVFKRFTESGPSVPTFLGPANLDVFKTLDSLALIYGAIVRR